MSYEPSTRTLDVVNAAKEVDKRKTPSVWQLCLAIIVLVVMIIFFTQMKTAPLYLTEWVLILFTIYLVLYIFGWTTELLDATIFTLATVILVGFIVIFIVDVTTDKAIYTSATAHKGNVAVLFAIHLLPIIVLLCLNGFPKVQPYTYFIIGLMVVYIGILLLITGHGVARQYQMPEKWWSYLIFFATVFGTVLIITWLVGPVHAAPGTKYTEIEDTSFFGKYF